MGHPSSYTLSICCPKAHLTGWSVWLRVQKGVTGVCFLFIKF